MKNLVLESKCEMDHCNNEYDFIVDDQKLCLKHCPEEYEISLKKQCQYCDLVETDYVCRDCMKLQNKKEWSIVRYIKRNIDTPFIHNSSQMLQGCSLKRPDVYFELAKHCVIVEVDENQHHSYSEICECARINEIVNGIGGKSVILIRYNPDKIKHKNIEIKFDLNDKLNTLIQIIKTELSFDYDQFIVKLIQLYYNDNNDEYCEIKIDNITDLVCV